MDWLLGCGPRGTGLVMGDGEQDAHEAANSGLAELVGAARKPNPPVDQWNPPYCGDIGLAIRADGSWVYRGSPILRRELVKLFASILRRDDDGRYYLVSPVEKVDVVVADAPFLAVEMELRGEGQRQTILLRTNVDDVVAIGPEHPLRFAVEAPGGGLKPYVRVRGRLEALATRALTFDLVEMALATQAANGGPAGVWSGGHLFRLPEAS